MFGGGRKELRPTPGLLMWGAVLFRALFQVSFYTVLFIHSLSCLSQSFEGLVYEVMCARAVVDILHNHVGIIDGLSQLSRFVWNVFF